MKSNSKNYKKKSKIKKSRKKREVNYKVVNYSLIAILCLVLTFVLDWFFIIPAVLLAWLNQRELFNKKQEKE